MSFTKRSLIDERHFYYRGEAFSVGGCFYRAKKDDEKFWIRGSGVTLPFAGGIVEYRDDGAQKLGYPDEKPVVEWKGVTLKVSGKGERQGTGVSHVTTVHTKISEVKIHNDVTLVLKNIEFELTSTDFVAQNLKKDRDRDDTGFTIAKVNFGNPTIQVGDQELGRIQVPEDTDFGEGGFTWGKILSHEKRVKPRPGNPAAHSEDRLKGNLELAVASFAKRVELIQKDEEKTLTPPVQAFEALSDADRDEWTLARRDGLRDHEINIWGLGTIAFGEMLVTEVDRRFSLIRIKLGCSTAGTVTICGGATDGHTYP